ncbi:MAG: hypothetical protein RR448_04250 [Niameybacter sp.]|uniref:hypothetical protein n=1 Tax=Niameybacter sp. TaxID=2033640 RepID=UPI002FC96272
MKKHTRIIFIIIAIIVPILGVFITIDKTLYDKVYQGGQDISQIKSVKAYWSDGGKYRHDYYIRYYRGNQEKLEELTRLINEAAPDNLFQWIGWEIEDIIEGMTNYKNSENGGLHGATITFQDGTTKPLLEFNSSMWKQYLDDAYGKY